MLFIAAASLGGRGLKPAGLRLGLKVSSHRSIEPDPNPGEANRFLKNPTLVAGPETSHLELEPVEPCPPVPSSSPVL